MTGKERILAAFRSQQPDYVPFSPNIYQWFYYHRYNGSLPPDLAGAEHPFDVLRYLGADILARWDTQRATRPVYAEGEYTEVYGGDTDRDQPLVTAFNVYPPHSNERHRQFVTPYGTLTQAWTFIPTTGADFESKHWWTSWDEYDAVRFILEATEYIFDPDEFQLWVERVGEDGVVMLNVTQSPLKTLHWLAGAQNATYFIMDHPDQMGALAKIHEEKALAFLEQVVDHPEAQVFISHDNLDAMFYPPYYYQDYCHDFFAQAGEIIHSRGKVLVVHACGRNKALLPLVGVSKIDCLEGITPPPLGDVHLGDVRELVRYESFTVNGGMDTSHQEITQVAEARLHAYTRALFESMGDKRHFIYASSCNTSPLTRCQNLVTLRDAARECGQVK
jgi:hypothetical protein